MPRCAIFPYNMASQSARALQAALRPFLRTIRVYPNGRYRPRATDLIINWGNSTFPTWWEQTNRGLHSPRILNHPNNVGAASDKLSCLRILQEAGVPTVQFTTDPRVATGWNVVYARTLLRASEGRGIEIWRWDSGCHSQELLCIQGTYRPEQSTEYTYSTGV